MDGVADNFTEGDGGARETREVRAREADKTRRKVDGVADNSAEVARKVRAGGAREAEEIADNFTEEDEFPEENAAVLEKLEKNGAFAALAGEGGVADNSVEETRKVRETGEFFRQSTEVRAGGARNFYLEADWSLERYELEKQKKLLIILQKETNFLKKEPEVLEKLK